MSQQKQPRPGLRFKTKIQFLMCPHLSPPWGKAISPLSHFVGVYLSVCVRERVCMSKSAVACIFLVVTSWIDHTWTTDSIQLLITPSTTHFRKESKVEEGILIGASKPFYFCSTLKSNISVTAVTCMRWGKRSHAEEIERIRTEWVALFRSQKFFISYSSSCRSKPEVGKFGPKVTLSRV